MSRVATHHTVLRNQTKDIARRAVCVQTRILCSLLSLPALILLAGCQGVSSGSSAQQQSSILTLAAASLDFGSVNSGTSKSLSTNVTNSGSASIDINSISISTKCFSLIAPMLPTSIAAGQSLPIKISFTPSAAGDFSANVSITSNASDSVANIALSGTGILTGQLTPIAANESFGNVTVGNTAILQESLTNTEISSVTISQLSVTGSGFSVSGIATPMTLAAGQTVTFNVKFAPKATGTASGALIVASDATDPTLTIPLSGSGTTATGQLAVSPGTLNVGNVMVGTSGTTSGTLSASGATVTITGAVTNNTAFTIGGVSLPLTLTAGQSHSFKITFSPAVTGAATATVTFSSNAQASTILETLSGSGTPAPTHSVNLSWNASSSPDIAGYNIYRAIYAGSCSSFTKINSVLNTGTLYTDSTVTDATSYCYAATTVDTSNVESGYSNIVSNIQIPIP